MTMLQPAVCLQNESVYRMTVVQSVAVMQVNYLYLLVTKTFRGELDFARLNTHAQPFYSPFSATTQVSWCQKRTSGRYGARED